MFFNIDQLIARLKSGDLSDEEFDGLYEEEIQQLSYMHWTPIQIAITSVNWLKEVNSKHILDIGSGVGKFCIVGSIISKLQFNGVEKRASLCEIAESLRDNLGVSNTQCKFINEDIINLDFQSFDTFYYFNPFLEQKVNVGRIDHTIDLSEKLYDLYESTVFNKLNACKAGTKLITYCSEEFSWPTTYKIQNLAYNGRLMLLIKE